MKTRSQTVLETSQVELAVEIDFDHASRCWLSNKKRLENGTYKYVCGSQLTDGSYCKKKLYKHSPFCYQHK